MKSTVTTAVCAAVLLAFSGLSAIASLNTNPYQVISVRNPFGLRAIPIEKVIEKTPEPLAPSMEIRLTGVAGFSGNSPRAFLEFFDPQTKKTDRPPPFREGDRYDEHVQIVSIDAPMGLVRIIKDGSEVTLDFERNGIKEGSSAQASGPARNVVATIPPPPSLGGRLVIPTQNPPNGTATMTREELLARIAQRSLQQQQNPSVPNIIAPAASRVP
jgi:hypothetical protein